MSEDDTSPYFAIALLIEKLLTGDLSVAEKKQLESWLAENEENRRLLRRLQKMASEEHFSGCWKNDSSAAWKNFADKYLSKDDKQK